MTRPRQAPTHVSDNMIVYRRPDPVLVARIVDEYSPEAACERWSSLAASTVIKLAQEGRRLAALQGKTDTPAMRDCVDCERPFFSSSAANVVCRICKHESAAVFS